ncbi:hypothetical protein TRFO_29422 [Tritrichomonas foetus]|uniref:CKK domain-containing protein n=1 Tax=Tritrichomonas foetus TaxID=1144522 RepID=A0A1J4JW52_9EUKA|nr:hypothetical protein TRFO_29422 [Tritrichomonas foetus]|eukprot:OHT03235.1 hypothetical protein TRFO_29422 [Tritrichomonas foetus]
MEKTLDFDVHLQWLSIAVRRVCSFEKENQKPLLSLSFNNKCPIYDESINFPDILTVNDLSTGLPYVFILNLLKTLPNGIDSTNPQKAFKVVLSTLAELGYKPSGKCEIDNLCNQSISDHVELAKLIEWAVVDRTLSIQMLCDDLKRLPRSFFILEQRPDLLEDAIKLWLSKFPCSYTLPDIKNLDEEIFQGQHIAFSLARVYPKRILKDVIDVGPDLTDLMITHNWELALSVLEELMAFIPPKRQFQSPHIILLFFADIFYSTRSGAKKFVKLDPPPPPVVEPRPYIPPHHESNSSSEPFPKKPIKKNPLLNTSNNNKNNNLGENISNSPNKSNLANKNKNSKNEKDNKGNSKSTVSKNESNKNGKSKDSNSASLKGKNTKNKSNDENNIRENRLNGSGNNNETPTKNNNNKSNGSKSQKKNAAKSSKSSNEKEKKKKPAQKKNNSSEKKDHSSNEKIPNKSSSDEPNEVHNGIPELTIHPELKTQENDNRPHSTRNQEIKILDHKVKPATCPKSDEGNENNFSDGYVAPFSKTATKVKTKPTTNFRRKSNKSTTDNNENNEPTSKENAQSNILSNTVPEENILPNTDFPEFNTNANSTFPMPSNLQPSEIPGETLGPSNDNGNNQSSPKRSSKSPRKSNRRTSFSSDDSDDGYDYNYEYYDDDNDDKSSRHRRSSKARSRRHRSSSRRPSSKSHSKSSSRSGSRRKRSSSPRRSKKSGSSSSMSSSSSSHSSGSDEAVKLAKNLPEQLAKFQDEINKFDIEAHRFSLEAQRLILENLNNTSNDKASPRIEDLETAALALCLQQKNIESTGVNENDIEKMKEALTIFSQLPQEEKKIEKIKDILEEIYNRNIDEEKINSPEHKEHIGRVYDTVLSLLKKVSEDPESIPHRLIEIAGSLFEKADKSQDLSISIEIEEEEANPKDDENPIKLSSSDDSIEVLETVEIDPDETIKTTNSVKEEEEEQNENQTENTDLNGENTNDTKNTTNLYGTTEVETETDKLEQTHQETQTDEKSIINNQSNVDNNGENKDENDEDIPLFNHPVDLKLFEPVILFEKPEIKPSSPDEQLDFLDCDISIKHIPFRRFTSFNRQAPTQRVATIKPNFKIITTIIRFNAMPAPQQDIQKNKLLNFLKTYENSRLIVLMTVMGLKMKAIYKMITEDSDIEKIWGNGPTKISQNDVGQFYKYFTGTKKFETIPTKHFTQTTDGICLKRKIEPRNW